MSEQVFMHVRVSGKKFEKSTLPLDNMRFENCQFKDCDLFYSGGPVETVSCYFENIRWHFQGAAALTVEAMRAFGWKIMPPSSE
jgi:hypothetical protein